FVIYGIGGLVRGAVRSQGAVPFQKIFDPIQQFGQRERFGDVLVGSNVKGVHAIFSQTASTQYDNRHQFVDGADRRTDFVATHPWQHQIENDQIDSRHGGLKQLECRRSVAREQNVITFLLEIELQAQGQCVFVFHYQDAHPDSPSDNIRERAS